MANEQAIQMELQDTFPYLNEKIVVTRERRIWAEVASEHFFEVFDYLVKHPKWDFPILCLITGLDSGDNLEFIYHLARRDGTMFNLKTFVPKSNPVHKTVTTDYFPGAELYERELVDVLGAKIEGLPPGNRYPLPDGWPDGQYPLRKDWTPDMLDKGNL
ncbi:MAG: NADH-quinone oxidoreductase subunit C [Acidobacteriota bacterium]|jgi:Ni,Fe-hydrogenase III component G|nr:NADH-quinone oxidoreductase subunit C [Acidobacteriota bacterium]